MDHLIGIILTLGYTALFLFLIGRMSFFHVGTVPVRWFKGVFLLKVLSGFILYIIYTYHYSDRSTADIWKYYDDAEVMFLALREHPSDYFRMLFGIGNDTPHFATYYDRMNHWYRPYGSSLANDTHTIIRFNALVRLFSFGHYNVHSVVANFLGMIGLTGIFHFLRPMDRHKEKWFFLGVFLMPGVMFWASGVLKEPLLLFGMGMFLYGMMQWIRNGFSMVGLALVGLSLFFLLTVKNYALVVLSLGALAWLFSLRVRSVHPAIIFMAVFSAAIAGAALIHMRYPQWSVFERMAKQQREFYRLAEGGTYVQTQRGDTLYIPATYHDQLRFVSERKRLIPLQEVKAVSWRDARSSHSEKHVLSSSEEYYVLLDYGKTGSAIAIPELDSQLSTVLKAAPLALGNALFRPFPWNVRSPLMLLSVVENLILMVLMLLAAIGLFRKRSVPNTPVFWLALSFALSILLLTGLVTPVVGAIVRYRVPALPFLVCALIHLAETERIEQYLVSRFPFFKRYF